MPMEGSLEMAATLLLVCAGVAKLRAPAPAAAMVRRVWPRSAARLPVSWAVRLVGVAEIGFGVAALLTGDRVSAVALALWYSAFTAVTMRLVRRAPATSCGCFGAQDSPVGPAHIVFNLLCAAIAVGAAARPPGAFGGVFDRDVLPAALGAGQVLVLAYLGFLSITALPALAAARRQLETR
jgi:hypothetical protein